MSKFIKDILRDKNSRKYSITKSIAVLFTLLFLAIVIVGLSTGNVVDHVLLGEILAAILTLTGFKNNFGYKGKSVIAPSIAPSKQSEMDEGEF